MNTRQSAGNRNQFMALRYQVQEAIRALEELCVFNKNISEFKRVLKIEDSKKAEDISKQSFYASVFRDYIITTVAKLFDENKKAISLYTYFGKTEAVKFLANKVIIRDIKRSRHTWASHMDKHVHRLVTVDELCNSELREILLAIEHGVEASMFNVQ